MLAGGADDVSVTVLAIDHAVLFTGVELTMLAGALVGLLRVRARRAAASS